MQQILSWSKLELYPFHSINIARDTTDPEIDSMTWSYPINCKVSHQMAPLGSVLNLTTIALHGQNWLRIWPLDGAIYRHMQAESLPPYDASSIALFATCKFGHLEAPLASVMTWAKLCISYDLGQVAQLEFIKRTSP